MKTEKKIQHEHYNNHNNDDKKTWQQQQKKVRAIIYDLQTIESSKFFQENGTWPAAMETSGS